MLDDKIAGIRKRDGRSPMAAWRLHCARSAEPRPCRILQRLGEVRTCRSSRTVEVDPKPKSHPDAQRVPQTQTSQFCALLTTPNQACLPMQRLIGQFHMRVKWVIGPDGRPLTMADLPGPKATRWVIRRKARVVAAVRGGLLSLDEACSRYTLTVEEILAWQYSYDRHGLAGLRTTRTQQYRQLSEPAKRVVGPLTEGATAPEGRYRGSGRRPADPNQY
jgi:hypothetical protein